MRKRKILGIILIVIGIILILLYINADNLIKRVSDGSRIRLDAKQMEENNKKEFVYNDEEISNTDVVDSILTIPSIDEEYVIGQIFIPEFDMNMAISKGVTKQNLLLGAATMKENQEMGVGNYALAGHYNRTKGVLFHDVREMPVGTHVYITDKKQIYHYKIYHRQIYPDTSFYMIENEEAEKHGKPIITLMTCNINAESGQRVFAVGELIEITPYEKGIKDIFNKGVVETENE